MGAGGEAAARAVHAIAAAVTAKLIGCMRYPDDAPSPERNRKPGTNMGTFRLYSMYMAPNRRSSSGSSTSFNSTTVATMNAGVTKKTNAVE